MLVCAVQMRRFEKIGLTRAQSEQMTEMLTEVVCINKEKISQQFVTKQALEMVLLLSSRPLLFLCVVLLSIAWTLLSS